jgi:hypothetical protein
MSFGFSLGDFVTLSKLVSDVVKGTREACGTHDELTREVSSLEVVLQRLENEAAKPQSILNSGDDNRMEELATLASHCYSVLNVLKKIVDKYNGLSAEKKSVTKFFKKVQFGNGEMQDLSKIRSELAAHTSSINLHLNLLSLDSQGQMARLMATMGGDVAEIRQSLHWAAASAQVASGKGDGSIWTTYEDDDKIFWRSLRSEMNKMGFPSSMLQEHLPLIKDYIQELDRQGAWDDPITEEYNTSEDEQYNLREGFNSKDSIATKATSSKGENTFAQAEKVSKATDKSESAPKPDSYSRNFSPRHEVFVSPDPGSTPKEWKKSMRVVGVEDVDGEGSMARASNFQSSDPFQRVEEAQMSSMGQIPPSSGTPPNQVQAVGSNDPIGETQHPTPPHGFLSLDDIKRDFKLNPAAARKKYALPNYSEYPLGYDFGQPQNRNTRDASFKSAPTTSSHQPLDSGLGFLPTNSIGGYTPETQPTTNPSPYPKFCSAFEFNNFWNPEFVSSQPSIPTSETADSSQIPKTFGTTNLNDYFPQTTAPSPRLRSPTMGGFSNPTTEPLIDYNAIASEAARPTNTAYSSIQTPTDMQSGIAAMLASYNVKASDNYKSFLQKLGEFDPAQKHSQGSQGKKGKSRRPKQKKKREEWVEYDDW